MTNEMITSYKKKQYCGRIERKPVKHDNPKKHHNTFNGKNNPPLSSRNAGGGDIPDV